jgi:hypothetical protein
VTMEQVSNGKSSMLVLLDFVPQKQSTPAKTA